MAVTRSSRAEWIGNQKTKNSQIPDNKCGQYVSSQVQVGVPQRLAMSERVRDLPQSEVTPIGESPRVAKLCEGPQGEVKGAAIFLSTPRLIALGVDYAGSDAVAIQVVDGELQLDPRDSEGADSP